MKMPKVGARITAHIKLGDGSDKACRVKVMDAFPLGIRVKMITAAEEVGLPVGDQTILAWDRFPSLSD